MSDAQPALCGVCHLRSPKYICPRCNVRYCSLDCYKGHSERCTEGFYRDSATAELRSITATEDEKQKMLEILQRLHEQGLGDDLQSHSGSSGGEDEEAAGGPGGGLSEQTAQVLARKLAAGAEISAADLAPEELQAFHRAVAAGDVSEVVVPWQPWWLREEAAELELGEGGTRLVAAVEAVEAEEDQGREGPGGGEAQPASTSDIPPPPSRPLPALSSLTKAQPSPLLQYHLLDLLYAYCFVLRLYNGDYQTDPAGATDMVFSLSAVLEATAAGRSGGGSSAASAAALSAGQSAASVLLYSISRACRPPAGSQQQQGAAIAVLSDVVAVLQLGRPVVVTVLMDLSRLLEVAKQEHEGGGGDPGSKRTKRLLWRLVAAQRKLLFFLSWANEQAPELYSMLALAAGAELEKHSAALPQGGGSSSGFALASRGGAQPGAGQSQGLLVQEL